MLVLAAACSKPAPQPPAPATSPVAPPSPTTVSGTVPDLHPGGLAFVMLEPKPARTFPPPAEPPVMDQVGQTFGPSLLFVRTGQPVEFRNSDDTLQTCTCRTKIRARAPSTSR